MTSSTRIIFESGEIISQFLHLQQSHCPCILYASETEGVCFGGKARKDRKTKKTTKKRKNTRDKNNAKQKTTSGQSKRRIKKTRIKSQQEHRSVGTSAIILN